MESATCCGMELLATRANGNSSQSYMESSRRKPKMHACAWCHPPLAIPYNAQAHWCHTKPTAWIKKAKSKKFDLAFFDGNRTFFCFCFVKDRDRFRFSVRERQKQKRYGNRTYFRFASQRQRSVSILRARATKKNRSTKVLLFFFGDPYGNRTHVSSVRG